MSSNNIWVTFQKATFIFLSNFESNTYIYCYYIRVFPSSLFALHLIDEVIFLSVLKEYDGTFCSFEHHLPRHFSVELVNIGSLQLANAQHRIAQLECGFFLGCRIWQCSSPESHCVSCLYLARLSHVTKYSLFLLHDVCQASGSKCHSRPLEAISFLSRCPLRLRLLIRQQFVIFMTLSIPRAFED